MVKVDRENLEDVYDARLKTKLRIKQMFFETKDMTNGSNQIQDEQ